MSSKKVVRKGGSVTITENRLEEEGWLSFATISPMFEFALFDATPERQEEVMRGLERECIGLQDVEEPMTEPEQVTCSLCGKTASLDDVCSTLACRACHKSLTFEECVAGAGSCTRAKGP